MSARPIRAYCIFPMARPTNALIVDDEPHVRTFARMLLREIGITEVWEVADGVKAVEFLNQYEPQLMLLDINMPNMNGMELLQELHGAGWDVPVIVLSSESAMKTVQDAAALGACGYILKHSPRQEALKNLRALVDGLADEGEPAGS